VLSVALCVCVADGGRAAARSEMMSNLVAGLDSLVRKAQQSKEAEHAQTANSSPHHHLRRSTGDLSLDSAGITRQLSCDQLVKIEKSGSVRALHLNQQIDTMTRRRIMRCSSDIVFSRDRKSGISCDHVVKVEKLSMPSITIDAGSSKKRLHWFQSKQTTVVTSSETQQTPTRADVLGHLSASQSYEDKPFWILRPMRLTGRTGWRKGSPFVANSIEHMPALPSTPLKLPLAHDGAVASDQLVRVATADSSRSQATLSVTPRQLAVISEPNVSCANATNVLNVSVNEADEKQKLITSIGTTIDDMMTKNCLNTEPEITDEKRRSNIEVYLRDNVYGMFDDLSHDIDVLMTPPQKRKGLTSNDDYNFATPRSKVRPVSANQAGDDDVIVQKKVMVYSESDVTDKDANHKKSASGKHTRSFVFETVDVKTSSVVESIIINKPAAEHATVLETSPPLPVMELLKADVSQAGKALDSSIASVIIESVQQLDADDNDAEVAALSNSSSLTVVAPSLVSSRPSTPLTPGIAGGKQRKEYVVEKLLGVKTRTFVESVVVSRPSTPISSRPSTPSLPANNATDMAKPASELPQQDNTSAEIVKPEEVDTQDPKVTVVKEHEESKRMVSGKNRRSFFVETTDVKTTSVVEYTVVRQAQTVDEIAPSAVEPAVVAHVVEVDTTPDDDEPLCRASEVYVPTRRDSYMFTVLGGGGDALSKFVADKDDTLNEDTQVPDEQNEGVSQADDDAAKMDSVTAPSPYVANRILEAKTADGNVANGGALVTETDPLACDENTPVEIKPTSLNNEQGTDDSRVPLVSEIEDTVLPTHKVIHDPNHITSPDLPHNTSIPNSEESSPTEKVASGDANIDFGRYEETVWILEEKTIDGGKRSGDLFMNVLEVDPAVTNEVSVEEINNAGANNEFSVLPDSSVLPDNDTEGKETDTIGTSDSKGEEEREDEPDDGPLYMETVWTLEGKTVGDGQSDGDKSFVESSETDPRNTVTKSAEEDEVESSDVTPDADVGPSAVDSGATVAADSRESDTKPDDGIISNDADVPATVGSSTSLILPSCDQLVQVIADDSTSVIILCPTPTKEKMARLYLIEYDKARTRRTEEIISCTPAPSSVDSDAIGVPVSGEHPLVLENSDNEMVPIVVSSEVSPVNEPGVSNDSDESSKPLACDHVVKTLSETPDDALKLDNVTKTAISRLYSIPDDTCDDVSTTSVATASAEVLPVDNLCISDDSTNTSNPPACDQLIKTMSVTADDALKLNNVTKAAISRLYSIPDDTGDNVSTTSNASASAEVSPVEVPGVFDDSNDTSNPPACDQVIKTMSDIPDDALKLDNVTKTAISRLYSIPDDTGNDVSTTPLTTDTVFAISDNTVPEDEGLPEEGTAGVDNNSEPHTEVVGKLKEPTIDDNRPSDDSHTAILEPEEAGKVEDTPDFAEHPGKSTEDQIPSVKPAEDGEYLQPIDEINSLQPTEVEDEAPAVSPAEDNESKQLTDDITSVEPMEVDDEEPTVSSTKNSESEQPTELDTSQPADDSVVQEPTDVDSDLPPQSSADDIVPQIDSDKQAVTVDESVPASQEPSNVDVSSDDRESQHPIEIDTSVNNIPVISDNVLQELNERDTSVIEVPSVHPADDGHSETSTEIDNDMATVPDAADKESRKPTERDDSANEMLSLVDDDASQETTDADMSSPSLTVEDSESHEPIEIDDGVRMPSEPSTDDDEEGAPFELDTSGNDMPSFGSIDVTDSYKPVDTTDNVSDRPSDVCDNIDNAVHAEPTETDDKPANGTVLDAFDDSVVLEPVEINETSLVSDNEVEKPSEEPADVSDDTPSDTDESVDTVKSVSPEPPVQSKANERDDNYDAVVLDPTQPTAVPLESDNLQSAADKDAVSLPSDGVDNSDNVVDSDIANERPPTDIVDSDTTNVGPAACDQMVKCISDTTDKPELEDVTKTKLARLYSLQDAADDVLTSEPVAETPSSQEAGIESLMNKDTVSPTADVDESDVAEPDVTDGKRGSLASDQVVKTMTDVPDNALKLDNVTKTVMSRLYSIPDDTDDVFTHPSVDVGDTTPVLSDGDQPNMEPTQTKDPLASAEQLVRSIVERPKTNKIVLSETEIKQWRQRTSVEISEVPAAGKGDVTTEENDERDNNKSDTVLDAVDTAPSVNVAGIDVPLLENKDVPESDNNVPEQDDTIPALNDSNVDQPSLVDEQGPKTSSTVADKIGTTSDVDDSEPSNSIAGESDSTPVAESVDADDQSPEISEHLPEESKGDVADDADTTPIVIDDQPELTDNIPVGVESEEADKTSSSEDIPGEVTNEDAGVTLNKDVPEEVKDENTDVTSIEDVPNEIKDYDTNVSIDENIPEEVKGEDTKVTSNEDAAPEVKCEDSDVTSSEDVPEEVMGDNTDVASDENIPEEVKDKETDATTNDDVPEEAHESKVDEDTKTIGSGQDNSVTDQPVVGDKSLPEKDAAGVDDNGEPHTEVVYILEDKIIDGFRLSGDTYIASLDPELIREVNKSGDTLADDKSVIAHDPTTDVALDTTLPDDIENDRTTGLLLEDTSDCCMPNDNEHSKEPLVEGIADNNMPSDSKNEHNEEPLLEDTDNDNALGNNERLLEDKNDDSVPVPGIDGEDKMSDESEKDQADEPGDDNLPQDNITGMDEYSVEPRLDETSDDNVPGLGTDKNSMEPELENTQDNELVVSEDNDDVRDVSVDVSEKPAVTDDAVSKPEDAPESPVSSDQLVKTLTTPSRSTKVITAAEFRRWRVNSMVEIIETPPANQGDISDSENVDEKSPTSEPNDEDIFLTSEDTPSVPENDSSRSVTDNTPAESDKLTDDISMESDNLLLTDGTPEITPEEADILQTKDNTPRSTDTLDESEPEQNPNENGAPLVTGNTVDQVPDKNDTTDNVPQELTDNTTEQVPDESETTDILPEKLIDNTQLVLVDTDKHLETDNTPDGNGTSFVTDSTSDETPVGSDIVPEKLVDDTPLVLEESKSNPEQTPGENDTPRVADDSSSLVPELSDETDITSEQTSDNIPDEDHADLVTDDTCAPPKVNEAHVVTEIPDDKDDTRLMSDDVPEEKQDESERCDFTKNTPGENDTPHFTENDEDTHTAPSVDESSDEEVPAIGEKEPTPLSNDTDEGYSEVLWTLEEKIIDGDRLNGDLYVASLDPDTWASEPSDESDIPLLAESDDTPAAPKDSDALTSRGEPSDINTLAEGDVPIVAETDDMTPVVSVDGVTSLSIEDTPVSLMSVETRLVTGPEFSPVESDVADNTPIAPEKSGLMDNVDETPIKCDIIADSISELPEESKTSVVPEKDENSVTDNTPEVPEEGDASVTDNTPQVPEDSEAVVTDNTPEVPEESDHETSVTDSTLEVPEKSEAGVTDNTPEVPEKGETRVTESTPDEDETNISDHAQEVPENDDAVADSTPEISKDGDAVVDSTPEVPEDDDAVVDSTPEVPENGDAVVTDSTPEVPAEGDAVVTDNTPEVPAEGENSVIDSMPEVPAEGETSVTDSTPEVPAEGITSVTDSTPDFLEKGEVSVSDGTLAVPEEEETGEYSVTDNTPEVPEGHDKRTNYSPLDDNELGQVTETDGSVPDAGDASPADKTDMTDESEDVPVAGNKESVSSGSDANDGYSEVLWTLEEKTIESDRLNGDLCVASLDPDWLDRGQNENNVNPLNEIDKDSPTGLTDNDKRLVPDTEEKTPVERNSQAVTGNGEETPEVLGSNETDEDMPELSAEVTSEDKASDEEKSVVPEDDVTAVSKGTPAEPEPGDVCFVVPEIAASVTEVEDGIPELPTGGTEVDDGTPELPTGVTEVEDGTPEPPTGITEVEDGILELPTGGTEVDDGTPELPTGVTEVEDGTPEPPTGGTEVKDGILELPTGGTEVDDGTPEPPTGGTEVKDGILELPTGGNNADDRTPELPTNVAEIDDGTPVVYVGGVSALLTDDNNDFMPVALEKNNTCVRFESEDRTPVLSEDNSSVVTDKYDGLKDLPDENEATEDNTSVALDNSKHHVVDMEDNTPAVSDETTKHHIVEIDGNALFVPDGNSKHHVEIDDSTPADADKDHVIEINDSPPFDENTADDNTPDERHTLADGMPSDDDTHAGIQDTPTKEDTDAHPLCETDNFTPAALEDRDSHLVTDVNDSTPVLPVESDQHQATNDTPAENDRDLVTNDLPEETPRDSDMHQSTDNITEEMQRDIPAADDAKVTPSTPGDKTDKRSGKSKKKQKRKKGTDTGVEKKEPDVPAAAARVPIPDSEVRPDNGDNEGAITDTPVVTGAGDTPAEPDIPVSAVEDANVPATDKTTSTLVTNEEIPVEPELADTDKTPAQPEHTSTGLVTGTDEEIPSGPEKVDTSDERKPDDSSPVSSVTEQDDTPVAPERNSRLFTETTSTLVTGNDNKVMISCKHIVVVNVRCLVEL
jgi:hypothetical protein